MLVSSSIVQEDVLPAHLDVKLALVLLPVLHVLKMDSQLSLEPADLFVVMELLFLENNVMTETVYQTTDAHQPVKLKLYGHVLANHQYVNTTVHQYVVMVDYKIGNNVMMEIQ